MAETPQLKTVKQFVQENPAFTIGGLRHYIFFESKYGLQRDGVIKRLGRKILIDVEAFYKWVEAQSK